MTQVIQGIYRDQVRVGCGQLVFATGWSSNTIVESAWPLLASLLKNQPRLAGIQFWAVGAGDPAWDNAHVPADPKASQLHTETHRLRLKREQIIYLDEKEAQSPKPTNRIQVSAEFSWPTGDQTLREFGLFGGNATTIENSGYLINYVIHPRIVVKAGETLTRRLRLSVCPDVSDEWIEAPQHWLGTSSAQNLDGVGDAYAHALADAGIGTIGQLADAAPMTLSIGLPLMKLVELRAKARLALRTVAHLSVVSGLLDRTAWEVIVTPTATLAADAGASEQPVQRLSEQVSALQLALDNQFLQRVTIGELAQPW